jgi:hypothetical protein
MRCHSHSGGVAFGHRESRRRRTRWPTRRTRSPRARRSKRIELAVDVQQRLGHPTAMRSKHEPLPAPRDFAFVGHAASCGPRWFERRSSVSSWRCCCNPRPRAGSRRFRDDVHGSTAVQRARRRAQRRTDEASTSGRRAEMPTRMSTAEWPRSRATAGNESHRSSTVPADALNCVVRASEARANVLCSLQTCVTRHVVKPNARATPGT